MNAVVSLLKDPPRDGWGSIHWAFFAGLLLAIVGAALVTMFKPAPHGHAAAEHDFAAWLCYALLTVAAWGVYGIFLHMGQVENARPQAWPLQSVPLRRHRLLSDRGRGAVGGAVDEKQRLALYRRRLVALAGGGIVGAVGAFAVLLAFGAGGKPPVVMTIIFAGAPIVTAVVGLLKAPPAGGWTRDSLGVLRWNRPGHRRGALVTTFKPASAAHGPAPSARCRTGGSPLMIPRRFPSREAIAAHQLPLLRTLLREVAATNAFYAPQLRKVGLTGDLGSLDEFFRWMPFTRKDEIAADQLADPPYGTNLTYSLAAYNHFTQTSGTSGLPLRWLDTPESWQWMLDNWKQVFAAADVKPGDAVYFAFSFGPFLGLLDGF